MYCCQQSNLCGGPLRQYRACAGMIYARLCISSKKSDSECGNEVWNEEGESIFSTTDDTEEESAVEVHMKTANSHASALSTWRQILSI